MRWIDECFYRWNVTECHMQATLSLVCSRGHTVSASFAVRCIRAQDDSVTYENYGFHVYLLKPLNIVSLAVKWSCHNLDLECSLKIHGLGATRRREPLRVGPDEESFSVEGMPWKETVGHGSSCSSLFPSGPWGSVCAPPHAPCHDVPPHHRPKSCRTNQPWTDSSKTMSQTDLFPSISWSSEVFVKVIEM